ncbi:MAG TPA: MASE1 domain-containing protein, partial [Rhodanobacteraceae bacterium]
MYLRLHRSNPAGAVSTPERYRYVLRICVLVFGGYYVGTRLGLALTFLPNPISVLWPPNAILFSAMLLVPTNLWWVVIVAALPAHLLGELQAGVPATMVLCWFISNVTEAFMGATCVRMLVREPVTFDTLRHVTAFLIAAFLAVFVSSFLDGAFVVLNRFGSSDYWSLWRTRVISNLTSELTIVPVVVTWHAVRLSDARAASMPRLGEALALAATLLAVTLVVFDSRLADTPALICLPLPFLLWAALRFGPIGASSAFALVALLVIWGTGKGMGPFGIGEPAENAFSVQLFLMFVGPTLLCLAAAVTERSRAEQSLQSSDRRFQLVLQATRDSVYERDMATGALWWSANGLAQFGYPHERCPANFFEAVEFVHPEDRERAIRSHAAAVEGNETLWEAEFRVRRANGTYAHAQEKGFIVRDAKGRVQQVIATLTDVTERRDNEELSHRLAQATRLTAMGELTATIAHEINQPMSAILSNVDAAEMLLDSAADDGTELRQILADIRNDDLRASEVIRQIRSLAKKRDTEFAAFDLNELLRAVLRLVAPTMRQRGVAISTEFDNMPPV